MADARNYLSGIFSLGLATQDGLAGQLATSTLERLPDDYLETYRERVLKLTAADVLDAAQKYFDSANAQIVIVGDRAQIEEQVNFFGKPEVYDAQGNRNLAPDFAAIPGFLNLNRRHDEPERSQLCRSDGVAAQGRRPLWRGSRLLPQPPMNPPRSAVGDVPTFKVDPAWPKVPAKWKLGDVSSVAVDAQNHISVLHRNRTLPAKDAAMAAPPVMVFDEAGNFIKAWGGPGEGYQWPEREHGIHIDYKGFIWIGGNYCPARKLPGLNPGCG